MVSVLSNPLLSLGPTFLIFFTVIILVILIASLFFDALLLFIAAKILKFEKGYWTAFKTILVFSVVFFIFQVINFLVGNSIVYIIEVLASAVLFVLFTKWFYNVSLGKAVLASLIFLGFITVITIIPALILQSWASSFMSAPNRSPYSPSVQQCFDVLDAISISPKTCIDSNGLIKLDLKRNSKDFTFERVFEIQVWKGDKVYLEDYSNLSNLPQKNEEKVITIQNDSYIGADKIAISPIIKVGSDYQSCISHNAILQKC